MKPNNDLARLIGYLKYYDNKEMPKKMQKEIRDNWNRLYLWKYANYSGQRMNLRTGKPYNI